MIVTLSCLGNSDKKKKSIHVQCRCNFPPKISDLSLGKSTEKESRDMKGWLF